MSDGEADLLVALAVTRGGAGDRAADDLVHPRAAALLVGPRVGVEEHEGDGLARGLVGDFEVADVLVPGRGGSLHFFV